MEERLYDLIFICRPDTPEPDIDKVISTLEHAAVEKGGTIEKTEKWGRKRMAYYVQRLREGYYVYMVVRSSHGEVVKELGTKVGPQDKVQFGGETLSREPLRYLLLNKPKDFLTTSDDPMNRRTVMSLVENACKERIYPVGRLDRNTTGLLLFTNDGELAKKLMHPKFNIKKIYHGDLDKNVTKNDCSQSAEGLEREDGFIRPESLAYVAQVEDKKQVGIELHSGKNRVVRRIFEHLGYEVVKLDRVFYAGLTKKDLPRGKWRFLTQQEINLFKRI